MGVRDRIFHMGKNDGNPDLVCEKRVTSLDARYFFMLTKLTYEKSLSELHPDQARHFLHGLIWF